MAGRIQLGLLRTLGLEFYQKLPAAEMVKLAFERVPLEHASFAYKGAPPAAWAFARGRQGGMGFLDACADAPGVIARVRKLLESPDVAARLPDADRRHMVKVLEQADGAADARRRYLALIDEHFTYLWKFYCEPAARLAAPLPASIPAERRERDGRPALVARRMDGADGSLDAVAAQWPAAAYSAGFVTIGNRPAIAGTAVGAAFDRDRLYISVLCADRDPAAIRAEYRVGPELLEHQRWSKHFGGLDDSVAFILSASNDPQTCCQFSFNAKGVKAGKILHLGRGRQAEDVWVRETDWRVTAAVENGGWRGTAEIPRACLGDDCNWQAGCRMNVIRFFRNETLFPHVWSALRRDDAALDMHFYETARFGWLETGD